MSIRHAQADEINELLLSLWDKAVGTSAYDRAQWQRFQELLNALHPPARPKPRRKPRKVTTTP
jgi:hypothetical protein